MNEQTGSAAKRYGFVAIIVAGIIGFALIASSRPTGSQVVETPQPTSQPRPIESRTITRLCDFTTIKDAGMVFVVCDDGLEFTKQIKGDELLDPTEPTPIP